MQSILWEELEFELSSFCEQAGELYPVDTIYLFGSRLYRTGSVRSDIDLFFETGENIRPSELRELIDHHCIALDIFLLKRGTARSVVNESFVEGDDNQDVLSKCGAVKLWSRAGGLETNIPVDWNIRYASHIEYNKTTLPNTYIHQSIKNLKEQLQNEKLPFNPIIGETDSEVADSLLKLAERISKFSPNDFPGKGKGTSD